MTKMLIATADAFSKNATYIPRGAVVNASDVDWEDGDAGFIAAPSGVDGNAVVEVSAIAPTGPNPKNPQQIATGVVQTAGGYMDQGATLVGEVTAPVKVRITDAGIDKEDDTQAKVTQAVADAAVKEGEKRAETAKAEAKAARASAARETARTTARPEG